MTNTTTEKTTVSSQYLYNGNKVRAFSGPDMVTSSRLKTGTYEVHFNPESGYYLTKIPDMLVPAVIYGETGTFAKDVITTYLDRGCNTGVLLEGEQGSGKTMLSKILSAAMRELDFPTIVVNKAYYGPGFNEFMTAIDTPCMVFFDEFEKTYNRIEEKEGVLTFFDGVFDSNKLIVCTINDKSRMSTHMLNRPSRLYYMISYNRLSLEVIEEYCKKNLKDQSQVETVKRVSVMYGGFNFDMLKALVEELNRYNRPIKETLKYLNIRPSYTKFDTGIKYLTIAIKEASSNLMFNADIVNKPPMDGMFSNYVSLMTTEDENVKKILRNISEKEIPSKEDTLTLLTLAAINNSDNGRFNNHTIGSLMEENLESFNTETGTLTYLKDDAKVFYFPISQEDCEVIVKELVTKTKDVEKPDNKKLSPVKTPW